ncbi:hypothetical protein N7465_011076 [Penicillium sp. CMV-2018d]|nr:hypothetical protein N7465_011076 [Penicillium sp. CMV-2018d]
MVHTNKAVFGFYTKAVATQWDVKQQGESSRQGKNPPPRVVRGTNTEGTAPARSNSRAKKVEADINEEP